jgi:mannose-6-phosphate isomerase-like protein (cupin superfamily)
MATEAIQQGYVLGPDEGERIQNLGLRLLTTSASTSNTFMAAECTNPGPGGPPLHTHRSVDEFYYVLAGRYRFAIGDETRDGGPGTAVYVPRGTSHTFASVGPDEGKILAFTLPATERFLREMSKLQDGGVDQRNMTEFFRAFDSEITGPPLM